MPNDARRESFDAHMRGMCGRENIRNSEKDVSSPDNNWNARKADFADLVERENPDVAGFQEVLPDQMAFLKKPGTVISWS